MNDAYKHDDEQKVLDSESLADVTVRRGCTCAAIIEDHEDKIVLDHGQATRLSVELSRLISDDKQVHVQLTIDEATALVAVLNRIGGPPDQSRRGLTDAVLEKIIPYVDDDEARQQCDLLYTESAGNLYWQADPDDRVYVEKPLDSRPRPGQTVRLAYPGYSSSGVEFVVDYVVDRLHDGRSVVDVRLRMPVDVNIVYRWNGHAFTAFHLVHNQWCPPGRYLIAATAEDND